MDWWMRSRQKHEVHAMNVVNHVTITTPSFIALVPDYVKKELLQQIRDYIEKNS